MKTSLKHITCLGRSIPLITVLVLLLVGGVRFRDALSAPVIALDPQRADSCGSAEDCFAVAAWPKERLGNSLTRDQVVALKLKRLQGVMEQFPASRWSNRAGLLSGVLLIERNPAAALQYFRSVQHDFPDLRDYIQFWMGKALLHLGDAKEAAVTLETVPETVPYSNLLPQVILHAGEAWYQASSCPDAIAWLVRAVGLNHKEPQVAQAWLRMAACHLRDNNLDQGRQALKQLWVRFPQSEEAKEAEALLTTNIGGETWEPQAAEHYARAQAFLGQALHVEAIQELKKFLEKDPPFSERGDAKLKLGIAQVRLKRYEQAQETFQSLAGAQVAQSAEATVWLARVYLRRGLGEELLRLSRVLSKRSLSLEQKGRINVFAGIWLEDHEQFDEAIAKYQQVGKSGGSASQRDDAQWREGWAFYRTGRYHEAIRVWQHIVDQGDSIFEPQALYWVGRAHGQTGSPRSQDVFLLLCERYPYTYYCQLARERTDLTASADTEEEMVAASEAPNPTVSDVIRPPNDNRTEIEQQPAYRRAVELRALGLERDAARELAALTDHYSRDTDVLMALSVMLNEVGDYHHALRLVRSRFRDKLERTGGIGIESLWNIAYPKGLIPTITAERAQEVDPLLVAAIIREESHYDWRAVSRVGAIGLMQVMPATANAVAQRYRLPEVAREDLFDQQTNIRIGVRYVEQLLAQFSGNLVQTIAAYNAGPIVVESWVAATRGRSEDEFVELIPYRETRRYVKRVVRSYKEYKRLAGSAKPVS